MPERIILEHIHGPRNADGAPLCLFFRQPFIVKEPFIFILHQVRQVVLLFLASRTAFAAVACNVKALIGETADGQCAIVGAAAAAARRYLILEGFQLFRAKNRAEAVQAGMFSGNNRTAVGSHNTGNIRSDHSPASQQLKGPQYGFVIEGATLHNDIAPEVLGVADFDNLLQGVLDYGIGESCGQISQEAPSFCTCFTLEFINTVQREPRFTGLLDSSADLANSSIPSSSAEAKLSRKSRSPPSRPHSASGCQLPLRGS